MRLESMVHEATNWSVMAWYIHEVFCPLQGVGMVVHVVGSEPVLCPPIGLPNAVEPAEGTPVEG